MEETGRYKIYFRIWPFKYFLSKDTSLNKWVIMYKIWDDVWGQYRWKERITHMNIFKKDMSESDKYWYREFEKIYSYKSIWGKILTLLMIKQHYMFKILELKLEGYRKDITNEQ